MLKKKIIFSAVVCLVLAILGVYLSGALTLIALRQDFRDVSFLSFFYAYNYVDPSSPYYSKVVSSGKLGFGFAAVAFAFVIYRIFNQLDNLYGDAKFASSYELKSKGFFDQKNTSLIVGKYKNNYLYHTGQQFAILAAPTRSGKGVGIVIPNLLSYGGSVVVLDIKQENFEITSGFRQANGQEVYLFNPFAEDGKTHRWNPLSYVSSDPKFRISDLASIAAMYYPVNPEAKDQFWKNQAQNCFIALAMYLFEARDYQSQLGCPDEFLPSVTFGALYRLASGDGTPIKEYLDSLATFSFTSEATKNSLRGVTSQNAEVFASILGTFKEPLLPWLNPIVDAATSADDFKLTDVRKRKMTIYIGILPNKLAESKLLINLFFSQLINVNTKDLPQNDVNLKHQCLLLMDEFTSIGRVDIIAKSVGYMAGYNIRLFPIIQSLAQLDSVYGKEDSRTLITNHALQIIYTPRVQSDANDYSEMLGYVSARKESYSASINIQNNNRNDSREKRALMLPQELKSMSIDKEILIYEGLENPIFCDKLKYYADPTFKKRILPKVEIPNIF